MVVEIGHKVRESTCRNCWTGIDLIEWSNGEQRWAHSEPGSTA